MTCDHDYSFLNLVLGPAWQASPSFFMETYKCKQAWFLKQKRIFKRGIFRQHDFPTKTFNKGLVDIAGFFLLALAEAVVLEEAVGCLTLWETIVTVCQFLLPRERKASYHDLCQGAPGPKKGISQNSQGTQVLESLMNSGSRGVRHFCLCSDVTWQVSPRFWRQMRQSQ